MSKGLILSIPGGWGRSEKDKDRLLLEAMAGAPVDGTTDLLATVRAGIAAVLLNDHQTGDAALAEALAAVVARGLRTHYSEGQGSSKLSTPRGTFVRLTEAIEQETGAGKIAAALHLGDQGLLVSTGFGVSDVKLAPAMRGTDYSSRMGQAGYQTAYSYAAARGVPSAAGVIVLTHVPPLLKDWERSQAALREAGVSRFENVRISDFGIEA